MAMVEGIVRGEGGTHGSERLALVICLVNIDERKGTKMTALQGWAILALQLIILWMLPASGSLEHIKTAVENIDQTTTNLHNGLDHQFR